MSLLTVTRKSLRTYVFLVVFVCALATFTLIPISIADLAGRTPVEAQQTVPSYVIFHTAPPSDSNPELSEARLDFDLHPELPAFTQQHPTPSPPTHVFGSDGLLQVNIDGRHPILDLIDRAEHDWNAKLARASSTLPEAVHEYRRRYGRAPPPGFDRWWAYASAHNVQLPDEYDQIHRDLAPFWGVEPTQLQAIQRDWEGHIHSYTLAKSTPSDRLHVANETMPDDEDERRRLMDSAYRLINLMAEVEEDLPPFRAVFSPYDNPNIFITEEMKSRAVEASKSGEYIDIDQNMPHTAGWLHACHANSIANRAPLEAETPKNKTFIYDHFLAMDPCTHPSLLSQHGQFLSHREGPAAHPYPIPQFSFCSTMLHADIRVPHLGSWVNDVDGEGDEGGMWENREDERLLWRGTNTGIYHSSNTAWRDSQRDRLVEMVQRPVGNADILVSDTDDEDEEGEENMRVERVKKARLNNALLDIAFAGSPNQCEPETCAELERIYDWRRSMSIRDAGKYKYVLDVDGNGWSSRFKRLMTTNALVFKSTIYPEWFTERLVPWVHYIPIQSDYSDLYDTLVFFRGDLAGRGAHEELAAKIAKEGREWSLAFWREEDMVAYLFRLFLEYGRVMSEDRAELNFELDDLCSCDDCGRCPAEDDL